jgi:hypothetical protein
MSVPSPGLLDHTRLRADWPLCHAESCPNPVECWSHGEQGRLVLEWCADHVPPTPENLAIAEWTWGTEDTKVRRGLARRREAMRRWQAIARRGPTWAEKQAAWSK